MPCWAHNKMPTSVKQRYFELIREGHKGAAAARVVGVSTSCGSLWFWTLAGCSFPKQVPYRRVSSIRMTASPSLTACPRAGR